jgi:hypothetical protein
MPEIKPGNLDWLDDLAALTAQVEKTPSAKRKELAKTLVLHPSMITFLKAIKPCFDPAAIEKVRQAAQANPPYILSFNSVQALSGLNGKVTDLASSVHAALDVILSRRLDTKHIKALVEWMAKGNSPDIFNESETGKKTKTGKSAAEEKNLKTPADGSNNNQKMLELLEKVKAEIARGDGQTTYQDELKALLEKGSADTQEDKSKGKKGKAGKKSKSASQNEPSLFWEWMLGVKFMSQLKAKAKKGELTTNDKLLILVDKGLVKPLGWVFENIGKLLKKMAIGLWHAVEEAAGKTVKKILAFVLPLLLIVGIIWAVLAFFHFAVISPLHWIESKVRSGFHWGSSKDAEPAAPAPAPQPVTSSNQPQIQAMVHPAPEKKIKKTAPTAAPQTNLSLGLGQPNPIARQEASQQVYQPAVSFQNPSSLNPTSTLYDPKILESEIKSLPVNCVVKDYPMTPDEGMPVDVAVSRMQDITDPDKYTMMIGSDKQIVLSVNATNTTLTIQYKSADPFGGFLGGSKSPMNFLWEDVKYIHTNEIDVETKNPTVNANGNNNGPLAQPNLVPQFVTSAQVYQCSLVVSGSKYPLTIQYATAEDLEHLVSTMQYFIRNSRVAHDTALAGMPYPNQGLRLNNECLVEVLWANSPADKTGLQLGDMVWSVDKNPQDEPDRKKLEAQLGALTSGPHDLYIVSPADRNAGLVQMNAANSNVFNPKRHKVLLTAL